jgi:hypothetical protein
MKKALLIISTFICNAITAAPQPDNNSVALRSNASTNTSTVINALDTLVFDMSQAVYAGDYASIPVYMITDDVVNAVDFSLKFNEATLTYDSIFVLANYLSSYSFFNINDRTLRFTSSSLQPIETNKPLVKIRFTMLNGKKQVQAADFNTMKGYLNGDPCSVKVVSELITGLQDSHAAGFTVYPNPATSTINVEVSEKATVQLINMNGQIVMQSNLN